MKVRAVLLALAAAAVAAAQPSVRAELQPAPQRTPAADFALRDAAGKIADLKQYRGKILLLDFWATWCTGCKQEIPWFVAMQQKFGTKKFAVVGVSMDEGGWPVLKPFLAHSPIPYRILLGDDAIAKSYRINTMPDTFLIDGQGKIAAAYRAGLVDKDNVEANVGALLAGR